MVTKTTVKADTVTLRHLGAGNLPNPTSCRRSRPTPCSTTWSRMITKHLKKGARIRIAGLGILQVRKRAGAHGPQPGDRRGDQDQGLQEGRLPRRQGSQGSHLIKVRCTAPARAGTLEGEQPARAGAVFCLPCSLDGFVSALVHCAIRASLKLTAISLQNEQGCNMDLGIKGRKAIVCAASKGLGKGCAEALAREGVERDHLRARRRGAQRHGRGDPRAPASRSRPSRAT